MNATQYVYEFMQAQGLPASYLDWENCDDGEDGVSGRNVVGVLTGTVHPDEIVLVLAHLDDMPEDGRAPGADDNASGAVGVMLAAQQLAGHSFERTVHFLFTTGEEVNLCGGRAYAQEANANYENHRD
jgi:Zn-dependent M28 family amino/carboxypeptidase